jgi:hypothetical protein
VQVNDMEAVRGLCVHQCKARGAWCCSPGDLAPLLLPLLLSPILTCLSPHSYPGTTCLPGALKCRSFAVGLVLADVTTFSLPCLTEFQTLTIFDLNCNFNRNTFYRLYKIVKIIDYTLYIIKMYL